MQHFTVYRNETSYTGPISMLKRLESGDILLVFREALWRGFHVHFDPTTRTSLLRSTDNGNTWHSHVTPDTAGGNGTAINQLRDGRIVINNFRWVFATADEKHKIEGLPRMAEVERFGMFVALAGVFILASRTAGYTWEAPQRLAMPALERPSTAGRIVELEDGSLLLPLNGSPKDNAAVGAYAARSTDGGASWPTLATVAAQTAATAFQELRLQPLPGGRILAMMRTPKSNFFQAHSVDGGRTWSAPEMTPIRCAGSSPGDLCLLGDGRVLFTYGHRRPPYGVRACLSEDGGKTWDIGNEFVMRDDGLDRDMGYPSSQQLEDGSILTVYYWHHEDGVRYLAGTRWCV